MDTVLSWKRLSKRMKSAKLRLLVAAVLGVAMYLGQLAKSAKLRLLLAAVLFAGWIGWLAFLVVTTTKYPAGWWSCRDLSSSFPRRTLSLKWRTLLARFVTVKEVHYWYGPDKPGRRRADLDQ